MFPKIPDARTYDKTPQFQWVRLKNTGSQVIPPWSICEVTSPTLDLAGPDSPPFEGGMTFNAKRPTSYLSYQLASSGPFAIQPGDYGPGLHGSILATNESAAADVRAMPTKDSFGLYIGKGGPLVSTGQMSQGVTLWHYDPAGMDGYFLCANATAAATPPGENETCADTTLVAGSGALLVTDGGSFVELPETVNFYNALAVPIASGTVVFVHRNANGDFHTVGLGKKNCPPFLGTAEDDIPAGGTGTITKQPCGDGSPASESVPDVKNRGGEPIRRYCRVLVIPCSDECDYEAVSLNCPDEECDYTGSVYTVGSLFAGLAAGGVELNWQYQTERYQKGKLCSVTSGPILTTTIPTWHCCYPPVCDDIFYREVDCDDIYLAFYATSGLTPPVDGTNVGTATIEINGSPVEATMFGFCDSPTGQPLHHDNGPSVPCVIDKIVRANNGVNVFNISYENEGEDFNCCPDANAAQDEFEVGYIPAVCYPDPNEARKIVIAKCHATPPGTPWTSNFPSRARRTAARDPNCCEGVDDPDPCCCPDELDAGVYFEFSSLHDSSVTGRQLRKSFIVENGTNAHEFSAGNLCEGCLPGDRPPGIGITIPVWVVKDGQEVQASLEVQINFSCEDGRWSGDLAIASSWYADRCSPQTLKRFNIEFSECCIQSITIPAQDIVPALDPGYHREYDPPVDDLVIEGGCPINLNCQYDDPCNLVYTAALRSDAFSGEDCCCPPCFANSPIGTVSFDGTVVPLAPVDCPGGPYVAIADIAIEFTHKVTGIAIEQDFVFMATYQCNGGMWTGGITFYNQEDDASDACDLTHRFATAGSCEADPSEGDANNPSKVVIPAAALIAELPDGIRDNYRAEDLEIVIAGEFTGPCPESPQWKYCDTEATSAFDAPSGKWKYAGRSQQKNAWVYVACAERPYPGCEPQPPEWFDWGKKGGIENLGVHRLPVEYWQLSSEVHNLSEIVDSCCGCDPWSESGTVTGQGTTEMCCPEDDDDFPVGIVWGTFKDPLSRVRLMHFGDSVTMAVPVLITSNTLTLDENRTNRDEDAGGTQYQEVWVNLTIEPVCENGQASVDVYIPEYDNCCTANPTSSMQFLGSFPVTASGHTLTIPKSIVRKAISCAWHQKMIPCCDPADWELTTGIQLQFKYYGLEAICTRPDCGKVFTAALVPGSLTGILEHPSTGCCCDIGVKSFSRNYLDGWVYQIWNVPIPFVDMRQSGAGAPGGVNPPNHPIDVQTLTEVDVRPCPPPEPTIVPNLYAPGRAESSMIKMRIYNRNTEECSAQEDFFISVGQVESSMSTSQFIGTCETHDIKIEANTIHHMSNPASNAFLGGFPYDHQFMLFRGATDGTPQFESCVAEMDAEYRIHFTMTGECLSCYGDPIEDYVRSNYPDSPWWHMGPSALKGGCIHAACGVFEYDEVAQECVLIPPELPPPPPGWMWTLPVLRSLEWWGIQHDESVIPPGGFKQSDCCAGPCQIECGPTVDVIVEGAGGDDCPDCDIINGTHTLNLHPNLPCNYSRGTLNACGLYDWTVNINPVGPVIPCVGGFELIVADIGGVFYEGNCHADTNSDSTITLHLVTLEAFCGLPPTIKVRFNQ